MTVGIRADNLPPNYFKQLEGCMNEDSKEYKLQLAKQIEIKKEIKRKKKDLAYAADFNMFSQERLSIITKDAAQGYIPFKFNQAQQKIHDAVEKQLKEKGRVRVLILKARQQGISTYTAGRVFWKTLFTPYTRSVVLAHDSATSDALFTMSKQFIERMPADGKPELVKSNAKEIKFAHNDSGFRLYTAGSPEAGRGTTPTILHCSEVAFWQNQEKILAGLFQGVSSADGTEIILESTANGASGPFYEMWKKAEQGLNDYVPVFLPWHMTKEYTMEPPGNFIRDKEEDAISELYNLNDGQLWWRRMKIGESGTAKFMQEYPATPEEAFQVSGANVFDIDKIEKLDLKSAESIRSFNPKLMVWDEQREGHLEIWKAPSFEEKYIIGADVALGVGQDYSTAVVLNTKREVVGLYRNNRIDPAAFGRELFYLGRYFNNSLLAVESNTIGVATLQKLKEMSYVNLYHQTKIGSISNEEGIRLGFRTTSASKPAIIGNLKNWIFEEELSIYSTAIAQELKDYLADERGSTNAGPGCHDDTVMALAISCEVYRTHIDKLSNDRVGFGNMFIPPQNNNWI